MGTKSRAKFAFTVYFRGEPLTWQVVDMVVDDKAIVENKSAFGRVREACEQTYSYLWGTTLEVGLVFYYAREPKFYRMVCENRLKPHGTDPTAIWATASPHPPSLSP